jgi:hypothetical protein
MSSISKDNVWNPTWKTCWSTSHICTRYSNSLTWALIPEIRKNFKRPQSHKVEIVHGLFLTIASYSSCSLSCHSRTMVIAKYLHKTHKKKVINSLQHLVTFSLRKLQRIFSLCGSRRCPLGIVQGSCRFLWGHLRE